MKTWSIVFILIVILAATTIFKYQSILTSYAEFFKINNPSSGADAIVVLSGGAATRIPHALKLFSNNYAPRILLTDEKKINERFAHLFSTNEKIAKALINELNLNVSIITVPSLKGGATSTFDEAYDLREYSINEGFKHLILVTDAFHTRRAYHAFKKVFSGTEIQLEMSAASNDIFNEKNWWTSDKGISAYLLESIKYPVYLFSYRNANYIRND